MRRAVFFTVTILMLATGCAARRQPLGAAASFRVVKASESSYTLAGPEASAAPVELGKLMERQYGYVAGRGYIDVLPGMRLSATRAYFRGDGKEGLQSYLGTETGNWVWEPPRFRWAGSEAAPGLARPAGTAPIAKLIGSGRRKQRLYRLFFQIRWLANGRDSQRGSVVIGAPNAAALEAASAALMKEQPVACGARLDCIPFPALTTVTVDVGVTVNGDARWVPWGTTLRAIAPGDAAAGVSVVRQHGAARLLPVQFDADDPQAWLFPLLPRDRVEWPPVPGGDGPPVVERVAMSGPGGTIPVAFDVRGVVIVESMHDASVRPTAAMIDPIAQQLQADFPKAIEAMVRTQFKPGVNDAARDWVIARAPKADAAAALALLRDYVNVNAAALLAGTAGVPVQAINTGPTKTPGLAVTMIENAGHFPQLERPAEFNTALREVLRGMTASGR